MRKVIQQLLIISTSILVAIFLSACGNNGTGSRIIGGGESGGGTPGGGLPDAEPGTLSGSVWHDLNQNQVIDTGEPGLSGIGVNLYIDTNENGEYELIDELIETTTTDSNGDYSFTVTETGRYFVSILLINEPTIFDWLLTTNTDEAGLVVLRVDVTDLDVGINDLNFGFFNPTKWGFDISPNGSTIDIVSSPAIAPDGTIYIGSGNDYLYAINPNGTLKWQYQTGGDLTGSPAIGSDGTVYIGSFDRQIYAINPDGTLQWVYPTVCNFTSSPAIASDGTIYIAGSHQDILVHTCYDPSTDSERTFNEQIGILYALTPNGDLIWSVTLSGKVHSSPAIAPDGTIYIGTTGDNDDLSFDRFGLSDTCDTSINIPSSDVSDLWPVNGNLYAIKTDGTIKWVFKTMGDVDSSPAIGGDGTIYVGSDAYKFGYGEDRTKLATYGPTTVGFFYAITPTGTLIWLFDAFGDVNSSPAIGSDGTIYFGSDKNDVFALDPDGTLLWVYPTRDDVKSSPAVANDGLIYIGSNDESLYVLNPDGTLNTRYIKEAGSVNSSPSIATDGTLYFATEGGSLFAITRTSPLADTPWPKFRQDLLNKGRK